MMTRLTGGLANRFPAVSVGAARPAASIETRNLPAMPVRAGSFVAKTLGAPGALPARGSLPALRSLPAQIGQLGFDTGSGTITSEVHLGPAASGHLRIDLEGRCSAHGLRATQLPRTCREPQ